LPWLTPDWYDASEWMRRRKNIYGAHDADRTRDLSLTKGVLYH
jgi:hypothetical protein